MIPLHGVASREDLPLPFELVVAGAAATLLLTFAILAFAWRSPRFAEQGGTKLPRLSRFVDSPGYVWVLRTVVALLWAIAGAALIFGVDRIDNPVFGFVLVLVWVGLVPLSVLFGRVYATTNPVRLLTGHHHVEPTGSVTPAALALLTFLYLELVEPATLLLPGLQIAAVAWLAWIIVGRLRFRDWVARAEPFEVFATTVARVSPWTRLDGVLAWTNPIRNLSSWLPPHGLSWLACVLLGGTLYDAISASTWYVRLTQAVPIPPRVLGVAGLLVVVGIVTAAFVTACAPFRAGRSRLATADALAPSLVPLLVGYSLSHYGTYLYLEGQRTLIRMGDPLGRGWNLLGIAELGPDTSLFMFPMLIAVVQVLLIVAGHVLGAVVAHDISLRHTTSMRAQLPLLLLMVVLTVGGMLAMFG